MVDCSSPDLLPEAAENLSEVMNIDQLSSLPLVILCHKCDLIKKIAPERVLRKDDIEERLGSVTFDKNLRGVFETSSFEGEGIKLALTAIVEAVVAQEISRRREKAVERMEYYARMRRAQSEAEQAVREEELQECDLESA